MPAPKKICPSDFPFFHSIFQQLYKLKHNNPARDFLFHGAKCLRKLHMVVSQHVPSLYCLEPYLEWLYEMMAKAGGHKLGVRKVWTRAAWWTQDEREWLLTVRLLGKEQKIKPVEDEKSLWVRAEVHPTQNIVLFAWYLEEQFQEMYSMEDNMLHIIYLWIMGKLSLCEMDYIN